MNAGAWGKSISEVIKSITYLDEFGKVCIMNNIRKLGFRYRKSPFMKRKVILYKKQFDYIKIIPCKLSKLDEMERKYIDY